MSEGNIITVKAPQLPIERFEQFMAATTDKLIEDGRSNPQYYRSQDGERFEPIVLDKMRSLASKFSFSPNLIVRTPKQHFPDILSERYFGVEVKTTKANSWRSTGSSIVESLRDENVKRIYMMFGKLSVKGIDFRCKPYEQCLDDISVTHSPRYQIDMDIKGASKTIFEKLGMPYEQFRQSPDQIKMVKEYYRKRCQTGGKGMPWWIDETINNVQFMPESLRLGSSEVRLLCDVSTDVSDYLITCMFVLFPEILGNSNTKFKKAAQWLCSRHSIVSPCLRNSFTAGGKADIICGNDNDLIYPKASRVVCNFIKHIDMIRKIFDSKSDVYTEISYYASYICKDNKFFEIWKSTVDMYLKKTINTKILSIDEILKLKFVREDTNRIIVAK